MKEDKIVSLKVKIASEPSNISMEGKNFVRATVKRHRRSDYTTVLEEGDTPRILVKRLKGQWVTVTGTWYDKTQINSHGRAVKMRALVVKCIEFPD